MHSYARRTVDPVRSPQRGSGETVHAGGYWMYVPAWVPRVYAPLTRRLLKDVQEGLRRQVSA